MTEKDERENEKNLKSYSLLDGPLHGVHKKASGTWINHVPLALHPIGQSYDMLSPYLLCKAAVGKAKNHFALTEVLSL